MLNILVIIISTYVVLIACYYWHFEYNKKENPKTSTASHYSYTILIAYRNANENLNRLLSHLYQDPLIDSIRHIILVDDFSEKEYSFLSHNHNTTYLQLCDYKPDLTASTHNKKQAIELGISHADTEYILCLDADVIPSGVWLSQTIDFIEKYQPQFLAGIHRYTVGNTLWSEFLSLEQDILIAISIASLRMQSPTMCNGANMAFRKSAFEEVGGYKDLYTIQGGDDMLLYHRIYAAYSSQVYYHTAIDAAVYSESATSWRGLIHQRRRWLSKTMYYERLGVQVQLAIIFLGNVVALLSLIGSIFYPILIGIYLAKVMIDFLFGVATCKRFSLQISLAKIFLFAIIYPLYTILISICSFPSMMRPRLHSR